MWRCRGHELLCRAFSSNSQRLVNEIRTLSSKEQDLVLSELLKGEGGHRWFETADRNQDGMLSEDEFQAMLRRAKWNKIPLQSSMDDKNVTHTAPSWVELRQLMLCTALPFVGFGFLDNFIMLTAGDWIDSSIGSTLHLSTLAAAALGNTISDVAGLGMGGLVERMSGKVGVKAPRLSRRQMKMTQTRVCVLTGSTFGLTFGCVLGMVPLIFI